MISDDVRAPITLSPAGSAQLPTEIDPADVPVPGTPPGEDFWQGWLAYIEDEDAESEQQEFKRIEFNVKFNTVYFRLELFRP